MGFKDKMFVRPTKGNAGLPTRYLYLSGVGSDLGTDPMALHQFLSRFGELESIGADDEEDNQDELSKEASGVYMPPNRRYCFAVFKLVESAIAAHDFFSRNSSVDELGVSQVMAKYSDIAGSRGPPEAECTSSTSSVIVPGFTLIENFISEEEEMNLMEEYGSEQAPWKESLNRRVQHYGFPFSYRTLMIDYSKPTPPLPPSSVQLASRISNYFGTEIDQSYSAEEQPINQLTINEYWAGQGIAPHIDTESCFGSQLFIVNIISGIVMTLTKKVDVSSEDRRIKKHIYLPRRSLLILDGPARYEWAHGISPRKFDKVDGQLIPRERRISFTFRHVLKPSPIPTQQLVTGEIEKEHVVKVYDAIAVHWNHTRGKRKVHWNRVKTFIEDLPAGSLLADVGSGDGKYFGVNPNIVTIGCDRSVQLLQVSKEGDSSHETFACDAVALPLLTSSFDAVICIAVLHHLATVDRRYALISELVRISKDSGIIFIQAWALEQENDSKRVFTSQDTMVPWKLNKRFARPENTAAASGNGVVDENQTPSAKKKNDDEVIVYERYCHVYREGELEDLCSRVPDCVILESGYEKGNWFVKLQKVKDTRLTNSSIQRDHDQQFKVPTANIRLCQEGKLKG